MGTPGVLATLGAEVVDRTVLTEHDGRSGALLERVVLADGRRLVVKRSDPVGDLTVALGGGVQRERLLWEAGVLARLPGGVGHPVVAIGEEDGLTVTVMRDLGDAIPGWTRVLNGPETVRVLDAMSTLHAEFAGRAPTQALGLAERLRLLSPVRLSEHADEYPLAGAVLRGWKHFADLVEPDVVASVRALHEDIAPLAAALGRAPQTLVHGDLWLVNLALLPDEVVLLDWALATRAPAALDLAIFLTGTAAHTELSREAVIAAFLDRSPQTDERALGLALLAGLLEMGWNKALDAVENPDPAVRQREAADLIWWVERGERGLGLLS